MVAQLVTPPSPSINFTVQGPGSPGTGFLSPQAMRFLQNLVQALNGVILPNGWTQLTLGTGTKVTAGAGSPQGTLAGNPGDIFLNTAGGPESTLYVKETGIASIGWVAK